VGTVREQVGDERSKRAMSRQTRLFSTLKATGWDIKTSKLRYKEVKNLGLKFYNSDTRGEADFALDFQKKLLN